MSQTPVAKSIATALQDADDELRELAAHVDLLVLGAHDAEQPGHARAGRRVEQLADDSPCPIVVVPARAATLLTG